MRREMMHDTITHTPRQAVVDEVRDEKLTSIAAEVVSEIHRAMGIHAEPMHSAHEGWAVIFEELDELWDEVKLREEKRDMAAMRKEAIQVAAMAIRFVHDVCKG